MYNFMYLVTMVFEALEAANEEHKFCQELRIKYGIPSGETIYIPILQTNDAFRLGEYSGWTSEKWDRVERIAALLNVDVYGLISAVKSMYRRNSCHELYSRVVNLRTAGDAARMQRFLDKDNREDRYFKSTGRMKPWCKNKKAA